MAAFRSCIFLSMPTSGTGSFWRIVTAMCEGRAVVEKVAENHFVQGRGEALPDWRPEPLGHVYLYNTPHVVNSALADPAIRLIVNFRDPRDLSCNQYHWTFQHPMAGLSAEDMERRRAEIRAAGIDGYVLSIDNNVHLRSFRALEHRLDKDRENVLLLSYAQLCLGFDEMIDRLRIFLGLEWNEIPWSRIDPERVENLGGNAQWIGQVWSGGDTAPGRFRRELQPETIQRLNMRYHDSLELLRRLEHPQFRDLLNAQPPAPTGPAPGLGVIAGKGGQLFLTADGNDNIRQITGLYPMGDLTLFDIALAHRTRQMFGASVGSFDYVHAVVPNKEVVLKHLLPDSLAFEGAGPRPMAQYLASPAARLWSPFYDVSALSEGPDAAFPASDTHWSHAGALRYLRAMIARCLPRLLPRLDAVALRRFPSRQSGDLGRKLGLSAEPIEIVVPQAPQAQLVFENGIANEGSVQWYDNAAVGADRALILHDSFASWLKPLIPELFGETLFIHGTVFDRGFVRDFAPSVVLCLQIERFFIRVPESNGSIFDFVAREEAEKGARAAFRDVAKARLRPSAP